MQHILTDNLLEKPTLRTNLHENEETLCELWDEEQIEMKQRSRLYHLKPIGVGTPLVESLTSYVTRLAEAHSVLPSKLVTKEIIPLLNGHYLYHNSRSNSDYPAAFWRKSVTLNGCSMTSAKFVDALKQLTLRHDLLFLTMLPFAEVLSNRKLMRHTRAWCSTCYEEWKEEGQPIYIPLLWTLDCLTICPRHGQPFQQNCPNPNCQHTLFLLAPRGKAGFCPRCNEWLGNTLQKERQTVEAFEHEEWAWQQSVGISVGELLAATPGITKFLSPGRFATYIDRMSEKSSAKLAHQLQVSGRTIRDWRQGLSLPGLDTLLQICFLLGVSPLQLLIGNEEEEDCPLQNLQLSNPSFKRPRRFRQFDSKRVQRTLEAALDEDVPPSMHEMSRRLEYLPGYLTKYFPDLCRAISARYLHYQAKKGAERLKTRCEQVQQAVNSLHAQGYYPSQRRVEAFLRKPGLCREKIISAAWKKALQELGLSHGRF